MNVLFVSNDPTVFEATSVTRARMRTYAELMGELHIVSFANALAKEEQDGNLYLHPIHSWKIFRVRELAKRARALILEYRIQIVSAQDPFEHGLAALRAITGTRAKLHIQVHTDFLSPWFVKSGSWYVSYLNWCRVKIADRVLVKADGIRVVSERVKVSLVSRYGSLIPESSVIPVPIDASVPAPIPLPLHSFTFSLIAVGRLESEKRIEDILLAFKLVSKRYPMVGLFVSGDGRECAKLKQLTESLDLEKNVVFLGHRPDAWGLMQSADAFIQASAYEGYGRTLIEAALARVPIITTDVGIVGDVLRADTDVLVAPVADLTALSLRINSLIEDKSARDSLATHASTAARLHLSMVGDVPLRIVEDLKEVMQPGNPEGG